MTAPVAGRPGSVAAARQLSGQSPQAAAAPAGAEVLTGVRAGYGWLLACVPRQMIRAGTPRPPSARAVTLARVLGGRHLAQALLTATAEAAGLPPAVLLAAGASVDALHAASMAGLAAVYRPLRHAALADATLETGFAACGALLAWRSGLRAEFTQWAGLQVYLARQRRLA